MYLRFSRGDGRSSEAILLGAGRFYLRVAVPGEQDTMELKLVNGDWITEDGKIVVLDCLIGSGEMGLPAISASAVS
jgi:hypothetical protein